MKVNVMRTNLSYTVAHATTRVIHVTRGAVHGLR